MAGKNSQLYLDSFVTDAFTRKSNKKKLKTIIDSIGDGKYDLMFLVSGTLNLHLYSNYHFYIQFKCINI